MCKKLLISLSGCMIMFLWNTAFAQSSTNTEAFSIVEQERIPEELIELYSEADTSIWIEDNVAIFFLKQNADSVYLDGSIETPMQRINGSDLWTVAVKIPNLSQAVLSYRFRADDHVISPLKLWRGPDAPEPAPKVSTVLQGKIYEHEIESDTLKEVRRVSIYLPPGFSSGHHYPVIYMGDGQELSVYAFILEALVLENKITPAIMIGVHSADYQDDKETGFDPSRDLRSIEYLEGFDQYVPNADTTRFEAHEFFFLFEVSRWAEKRFGKFVNRDQRLLFGTSNSASFAISEGLRNPEYFKKIIAFSAGWQPALKIPEWDSEMYPQYYLAAGTLDSFLETTLRWAEILEAKGFKHVLKKRVSGHDSAFWQEEFSRAIVWALEKS